MKIRKGDNVVVLSGKDRGVEGTVELVIPKSNKVVVTGVNTAKKHRKAQSEEEPGGIVEQDMPIDVSNVAVLSPKDQKATRVGYKIDGDKKIRICKRTGEKIPEASA